jgi:hypothetical protein
MDQLGLLVKFKYSKIFTLAEAGTQTAGLGFGGYSTAATGATEEYDGSTWTSNPTGLKRQDMV